MTPFISCVCPTYKRPKLLQNAVACFQAQNYPKNRCELIICDDANQFTEHSKAGWSLLSTPDRFPNLPAKFNYLISKTKGDIIAIWEDDDIFLPWHLKDIAVCYLQGGFDFFTSKNIWSTYQQPLGQVQIEDATGRFHSSWRFTKKLFDKVNGYPDTNGLSFDQDFGFILKNNSDGQGIYGEAEMPSYVYRWGNGYWHGSQAGPGDGFKSLWDHLGTLPAPHQGILKPAFDYETFKIFNLLNVYKHNV